MPIENEYKYVLNPLKLFWIVGSDMIQERLELAQGLLVEPTDVCVRIRKSVIHYAGKVTEDYRLTVKKALSYGPNVEVETPIKSSDFYALWPDATHQICKTRYRIGQWELDFFYDNEKEVYLCMAEIELPEDTDRPMGIDLPDWLRDALIFPVEQGDHRFSNTNLWDAKVVREVLEDIRLQMEGKVRVFSGACRAVVNGPNGPMEVSIAEGEVVVPKSHLHDVSLGRGGGDANFTEDTPITQGKSPLDAANEILDRTGNVAAAARVYWHGNHGPDGDF